MVKKAFEAIYEKGILRPLSPLALMEGTTVRLSLEEQELQEHCNEDLLEQLAEAAQAADLLYPGPILAYEAAAQLQEFFEQSKEKSR